MGRTSSLGIPLPQAELVLTAALIGLNATRQAGSHVKACIAFGYSEDNIQAIVNMAQGFAKWQGVEVPHVDVARLAQQARVNLNSQM